MIFQHTWEKVLSGQKTQTRRIVKPEHMITFAVALEVIGRNHGQMLQSAPQIPRSALPKSMWAVVLPNPIPPWKPKSIYEINKTYAVQPGRGKKAVGRIRITDIRREDVRRISEADVLAEGFNNRHEFMAIWDAMHGGNDAWVIHFVLEAGYANE